MTYPDGGKVSYTYDALDRMTAITGRDGKTTTYAYNANGNMTKVTRPNGTFTELKYDAEGRITALSNVKNNGNIISDFYYTYDISECIIKETARQDGETVTNSYAYDGRMQLVSAAAVHPGYTLKTEYTYDNAGNRITEKVSKTQWGSTSVITDLINTYDANNRLIKQTNNASSWSRSITYQYDENGNMIRKDPPNSSYTTYEYDSENRLTAVHDGGALLFAALYDGNGDRVFTVAPRQNTGNWHDDWNDGRWAVAEPQNGYNDSEWTYSGTDTKPTEPTTEEPETEPITEPSTEPVSEAPTTTLPGRPVNPGEDDGFWWPGKYEGGDTGVNDGQWNSSGTTASSITTTAPAVSSDEWSSSKAYNAGDEVSYQGKRYRAKWWTKGENPAANASEDWQVWVLVSGTETTTAGPETITNQTSTVTTTVPATEPEEGETEPEIFEVTGNAGYDRDMIWDVLYVPNGINTAYLEENYVLTGYINDVNTEYTQVLAEYGKSGDYDSVYEYGIQRTSMYQNSQVYSYEYDGRGSVSELVNAVGKTQIKYGYGAYGETISTVIGWNNPITNPYRYNAERIDDVAGVPAFQYLRARYLNPYTASFLTQDSYLGELTSPLSQNRYAYAHNNPVMYVDPSGHIGHILGGALVGALVGAVKGAVEVVAEGIVSGEGINLKKVAVAAGSGIVAGATAGAIVAATGNTKAATMAYSTINGGLRNFGDALTEGKSLKEAAIEGGKGMLRGAGTGFILTKGMPIVGGLLTKVAPKASPVIGKALTWAGSKLQNVGVGNVINNILTSHNLIKGIGTVGVSTLIGFGNGIRSRIESAIANKHSNQCNTILKNETQYYPGNTTAYAY